MAGLIRNETIKLFKTKFLYVISTILILYTAVTVYVEKTKPDGWETTIPIQNAQSLPLSVVNTLAQIMMIFISIFAARNITDEYRKGTLKLSMLCPIHRLQVLHSKVASVFLLCLSAITVHLVAAYAIGWLAFGWGDITIYKDAVFSPMQGVFMTLLAYTSLMLPYMAFGMIAVFIALKAENMTTTIILSIGIGYIGQFLYPLEAVKNLSIVTQMHYFPAYVILNHDTALLWYSVIVNVVYLIVFYFLSARTIRTRDILY